MSKKKKPLYGFVDADPIAYKGASSAERILYQWKKLDGSQESKIFRKAADAKVWMEGLWDMGVESKEDWERSTEVDYGTIEQAIAATEAVVQDYLKTFEKFSGRDSRGVEFWLTRSDCVKVKDIGGLENQYQFNRIGKPKPRYLKEVREYLMKREDAFMSPAGFEADAVVITKAELKGQLGVVLSIDKDLDQAMGTWLINTYPSFKERKLVWASELGELWEETLQVKDSPKTKVKQFGTGFLWLCYQAMQGDINDGYKGLSGCGPKAALEVLQNCGSKEEAVTSMLSHYESKMEKGLLCKEAKKAGVKPLKGHIKYLSWDGKRVKLSARGLLQQHFFLAFQERGKNSVFNIGDYL